MANRTQYSEDVKAIVKAKYHLCRTPEDRDALAQECGIGSRQKLYNLASRLCATRPHANSHVDWADEEDGYDATQDSSRLYMRDEPATLLWTPEHDRYLDEHFGRTFIESIGFMLNRSETACAYRARHLGKRNVPKYYDMKKVAAWLGLSYKEIFVLGRNGLEVRPCTDENGKLSITLISTTSLARVLYKDRFWKRLVDERGADKFFIRDIGESIVALQKGEIQWEANCWVSHGHTCLNPFSKDSFQWFYNGHDKKMVGKDLDPRDLAPSANVGSDNWVRNTRGRGIVAVELEEDTVAEAREEEYAYA